jgi:chromosome segregation ATPase
MEVDQIQQQVDFIDNERRKDKAAIATLEQRLTALEGSVPGWIQQIHELSSDLSRTAAQLSRFDEIESAMVQIRVDQARALESIEKQRQEHDRELEKVRRSDQEAVTRSLAELRKALEVLPDMKRTLQSRIEEEYRLGRLIEEVEKKVKETARSDEEYTRIAKLTEEGRRQDSKRIADVQGEQAALRKRVDEQRGKIDLSADSARKLELRLGEFQATDIERRQVITSFIEKQTLSIVERDRGWKDMQVRFDEISNRASNLDSQLQSLDATQRVVKRAQEAFEEITQRFERRMNEITEMQRLVEERFRQEWVGFKADDQKRWTNYTLAHDEQQRETGRSFEKINERLAVVEDSAQEVRDQLHISVEETQKRLQSLLAQVHNWVEEFDRTVGQSG